MPNEYVLADDIEHIKAQLEAFEGYSLARDITARMEALSLSQIALAKRAHVSHAMIHKWLSGAKPHGKERYKELGMALGMDEAQLNVFLRCNCYPKLYVKNPLDLVCRFVLGAYAGSETIVERYRGIIEQYGLKDYVLQKRPADIATTVLSMDFANVQSIGSFEKWMAENDQHFRAFDKAYIPNEELIHLILLAIGEQSINDMYVADELPITLRNLLYPLVANSEIAVKGLRAKLIVFGLYKNMAEDEIDMLLDTAKLQKLSEPVSRVDHALLTALRCAHERYPYFELNNARQILKSLREEDSLYPVYKEKENFAAGCVKYYESAGHKSEQERLFEEAYTDYGGSGLMQYVADVFFILSRDGILSETETGEYTPLMQGYRQSLERDTGTVHLSCSHANRTDEPSLCPAFNTKEND